MLRRGTRKKNQIRVRVPLLTGKSNGLLGGSREKKLWGGVGGGGARKLVSVFWGGSLRKWYRKMSASKCSEKPSGKKNPKGENGASYREGDGIFRTTLQKTRCKRKQPGNVQRKENSIRRHQKQKRALRSPQKDKGREMRPT